MRRVCLRWGSRSSKAFDEVPQAIPASDADLRPSTLTAVVGAASLNQLGIFASQRTARLRSDTQHRHTVVATLSDAGVMKKNANMMDPNSVAADAALAVWLEMWNTDSDIARRICSADFRIHFLIS